MSKWRVITRIEWASIKLYNYSRFSTQALRRKYPLEESIDLTLIWTLSLCQTTQGWQILKSLNCTRLTKIKTSYDPIWKKRCLVKYIDIMQIRVKKLDREMCRKGFSEVESGYDPRRKKKGWLAKALKLQKKKNLRWLDVLSWSRSSLLEEEQRSSSLKRFSISLCVYILAVPWLSQPTIPYLS